MAAASWAHISPYWASVAAIAAVFWPKQIRRHQRRELRTVGRDDRRMGSSSQTRPRTPPRRTSPDRPFAHGRGRPLCGMDEYDRWPGMYG